MARPSKVDRLPPEIRDAIGNLRRAGRTIDEILAHLRSLGIGNEDVSRTGLGRAVKKWDAFAARLNDSRAAADAIMSRIEAPDADDRVARLNIQSLHASLMELMRGEDGESPQFTPQEAMFVSATIKNLVSASKVDQSRYFEMKRLLEEERRRVEELKKVAEQEIGAVAAKAGITQATLDEINRRLGAV